MERSLKITDDGSHTMYVKGMEEPYHSTHGALQESMHIFIREGLQTVKQATVRILELGFGTGLNALLTLNESLLRNLDIYYHAVEKYPLNYSEYSLLNYEEFIGPSAKGVLHRMHNSPWGEPVKISDQFTLYKEEADFAAMNPPSHINLVYFDAFSPDKQPELWTHDIFESISKATDPGAILVTYSSRGSVRKTLISCGFDVSKVAGPPGKREILRAIKR